MFTYSKRREKKHRNNRLHWTLLFSNISRGYCSVLLLFSLPHRIYIRGVQMLIAKCFNALMLNVYCQFICHLRAKLRFVFISVIRFLSHSHSTFSIYAIRDYTIYGQRDLERITSMPKRVLDVRSTEQKRFKQREIWRNKRSEIMTNAWDARFSRAIR